MNAIACAAGVDFLMDYVEDVLPPAVRATIEDHVAGCPQCAAFVASYLETPRVMRDATAVTIPPAVRQSLRAFLRAQGLRQKH